MTGRWGNVPDILAGPAAAHPVLSTPHGRSFVDQKRAFLRDWLDQREVSVTDPEALRGVLLGVELLTHDLYQGAASGTLPPFVSHLVSSTANGLVVVLEPYLPEEARRG